MGLLNRKDSLIFRGYFSEMCKLIGISVGYQYITEQNMTIHSEDNSKFSAPIRMDILFDENPSNKTLNGLGWVAEMGDQKPIVINLPYNTPNLTKNARITVESSMGIKRPRVFKITEIKADLEFPDAYTCAIVPVYDQIPQQNQYTLVNTEKISDDTSERTSKDQPYSYITNSQDIDTTPEQHKKWKDEFNFIDEGNSPYSG